MITFFWPKCNIFCIHAWKDNGEEIHNYAKVLGYTVNQFLTFSSIEN